jgi:hypothetical protein
VRDGDGALLAGDVDEQLRDQRPGERGRERIVVLIDGAGEQAGEGEVAQEGVLHVARDHLQRAGLQAALLDEAEVGLSADVDGEGDDLVALGVDQPADRDRGVEAAGVGEDDLLGHGCSSGTRGRRGEGRPAAESGLPPV